MSFIFCLFVSYFVYVYLVFFVLLNFDWLCIGIWVCLLFVDGGGGNKDGDFYSCFRYGGDNDLDKSKGVVKVRIIY